MRQGETNDTCTNAMYVGAHMQMWPGTRAGGWVHKQLTHCTLKHARIRPHRCAILMLMPSHREHDVCWWLVVQDHVQRIVIVRHLRVVVVVVLVRNMVCVTQCWAEGLSQHRELA